MSEPANCYYCDRRVVRRSVEGPDWRALFLRAVEAFEAERPDIWLDDEFGVRLPELDEAKAAYR